MASLDDPLQPLDWVRGDLVRLLPGQDRSASYELARLVLQERDIQQRSSRWPLLDGVFQTVQTLLSLSHASPDNRESSRHEVRHFDRRLACRGREPAQPVVARF